DIVQVRTSDGLLGLHDFEIVTHAGFVPLARELEILLRHLKIFLGYVYLAPGRFEVEVRLPDIRLDLPPNVFELRMALCQGCAGLLDIALDPSTLPDRKLQTSNYGKRSVCVRGVHSD